MTRAAELCTDCGICCDGALFSSVALDAAGLVTAREQRLSVVETASECQLPLPCGALRGVLCGIYEERPECCAEYECELRVRVVERGLSLAAARSIIDQTRVTRSRVLAAVGPTPWWAALRAATEAERTNQAWARENAALLADLKALDQLIRHHFWG